MDEKPIASDTCDCKLQAGAARVRGIAPRHPV
jgi:hypothetical protein